jgi:hypothetical protein
MYFVALDDMFECLEIHLYLFNLVFFLSLESHEAMLLYTSFLIF